VLTAIPEQVSLARRAVTQLATAAGLDDDLRAGVALAVSEACSNVVIHAYAGTDPGELHVRAEATAGRLTVAVGDRGKGMCPRSDSPGIGTRPAPHGVAVLDARGPRAQGRRDGDLHGLHVRGRGRRRGMGPHGLTSGAADPGDR
jgi:two-component sensor histidine kinase